jgi:hypothetical protein
MRAKRRNPRDGELRGGDTLFGCKLWERGHDLQVVLEVPVLETGEARAVVARWPTDPLISHRKFYEMKKGILGRSAALENLPPRKPLPMGLQGDDGINAN